ncbi:cilia- and flagella-associated protein 73 [Pterocles gutturalis]
MALDLEQHLRMAFRDWLRTVPAGVPPTLLPSTRLLLKRRELAEGERVLQSRREKPVALPGHLWGDALSAGGPQEFRQRIEHLEQRRQQLEQQKAQLRDAMRKCDAFRKVSAAQWERALRQAGEARAWAEGQGAEAARRRRELEGLQECRERLARRLRSLQGCGDYLRGVLAHTGQFQDVPAMLAHFGALAGARAALAQEVAAGRERLAQGQARFRRYREEADGEILRASEELSRLRAQLEAARRDVLQGESRWAQVQNTATQKALRLGQIKLAVLNLFQLVTTQLNVPADVALEDTEAQLDTAPLSIDAALRAGPGCHLCPAAPQGAGAMSPALACGQEHPRTAPPGSQGPSETEIAPGDTHLLLGLPHSGEPPWREVTWTAVARAHWDSTTLGLSPHPQG